MSDELHEKAGRPGLRLARLEIYNWGTFDSTAGQVYVASPHGRTSLLVGRNGSGKSTLVDAILTLLVPNSIRNYNVAAGAGKTERSERTYVFGACDQQRADDENQISKRYLRKGNAFYSALLAFFHDEQSNAGFTLAQVLYPRTDGSIDKVFLFAEGEKSIANDLSGLSKSDGLSAVLKARGFRVTKTFSEYQKWFVRRTGVRPLALDMFNQTVAVKDIRSLNAFIRHHMLEASPGRERVQKLIDHFSELRSTHRQLLRIRHQQQLLEPIEEFGKQYQQFHQKLHQAERLRHAGDAYFRLATVDLATPEVERFQLERQQQETLRDNLKARLDQTHEQVRSIKNQLENAGGDRLREIPNLIQLQKLQMKQKIERRAQLENAFANIGQTLQLDTPAEFAQLSIQLQSQLEEINNQQRSRQQSRDELVMKRGTRLQQHHDAHQELDALKTRATNLPESRSSIRARICQDLGLNESDLPYAAELMAVADEHHDWNASIEMVLRNFALSLLVPDHLYPQVSDYIENTRLTDSRRRGQRLVYLRVLVPQHSNDHADRHHPDSLLKKLRFRQDHALYPWLRQYLEDRFDYRCCETVDDFRRAPRLALTRNRHTKTGDTRHEKDDRGHTADPSQFVLGWVNDDKKHHLALQINQCETKLSQLDQQIAQLEKSSHAELENAKSLEQCLRISSFDDIDLQPHRDVINRLEQEAEVLKSGNDHVRILEIQWSDLQTLARQLENQRDAAMRSIGKLDEHISSGTRLIEYSQEKLDTLRANGQLQLAQDVFPEIEIALGQTALLFDDLVIREKHFYETQNAEIEKIQKEIAPVETKVTKAMSEFLRRCQEESVDLDANLHSLPSFLSKLEKIRREDLPRYEARFKARLDDTMTKEIGVFHSELTNEGRHIVRKIDQLNQALCELPYNAGTYMKLDARPVKNPEIVEFRNVLRTCLDDQFDDTPQSREEHFGRIENLIRRLSEETNWRDRVIDVRRWYDFGACEIERQTGQSRSYYEDSSGQSGGEKARLAFTILVAAIAYQYDLDLTRRQQKGFHFVVVDEMFAKTDDRYADYALKLFERFGLQLMIVAPLDAKARVAEPYVQYYMQVLKDERSSKSKLVSMNAREYDGVLAKADAVNGHNPHQANDTPRPPAVTL